MDGTWKSWPRKFSAACAVALMLAILPQARASAALPTVTLPLPSHPFGVVATRDANWLFVSMLSDQPDANGVAVIHQENGQFKLARVVPLQGGPTGLVLTHDEKNVIIAAGDSEIVLDTARLTSGAADPIVATLTDGVGGGSIYANVTADDKTLFISEERKQCIDVIDLTRVRAGEVDARVVIGKIPVGIAPIALTFSPDQRFLYTTSELAAPAWGWPRTLKPETANPNRPNAMVPQGAIVVVNVALARYDPAHSVIARVPAGASPVRMVISADGSRIYVTARASNAVEIFDARKLISDPPHARLATVQVGNSPVPLALIQDGKTLIVGNSDRFGAGATQSQMLDVLDVSHLDQTTSVIGTIPAGAFPREMRVSSTGDLLFLTNFGSDSLQIMDARNPPVAGH